VGLTPSSGLTGQGFLERMELHLCNSGPSRGGGVPATGSEKAPRGGSPGADGKSVGRTS